MANYTAADIKKLREQTGAGMLDVKKALDEADGDLSRASEVLRIKGQKGVAKRESRTTSNGLVTAYTDGGVGVLLELDCETDFVAKGDRFQALAQQVLEQAVAVRATSPEELLISELADGQSVQQLIDEANAAIGEKIVIARLARIEAAHVASYLHRTSPDLPPQVGVLVGTDAQHDVARDVALHIAALPPKYLNREEVPAEVLAAERRVFEAKAREEGKPEQAISRIVEGQVSGFYKDNVLVEQKYAKDQGTTVGTVLQGAGVGVAGFARFRVGA